jgi:outer membrane protein assembly factor BamB
VTRDNRAWAIDARNGRVRWQIPGLQASAGFAGGTGPAVSQSLAVFPFSSGEILAVLRRGGIRLWSGSISGQRLGRVYSSVGDFGANPVIAGNRVYAATQSGRLVALELNTGDRIWTARTGAYGQIAVAGNALWIVADDGQLMRIDTSNGQTIWSTALPHYREKRLKRRQSIHAHYGPVLAGGRLILASSDGLLRGFDPATGAALGAVDLPKGAATSPIVLNGTLYVITADGHLRAFR